MRALRSFLRLPGVALLGAASLLGCPGAEISEPTGDLTLESPIPPFAPSPGTLRRLTYDQYVRSVHQALGEGIVVPPASRLEPDVAFEGLRAIGHSVTTLSLNGVSQYTAASYVIAEQALTEGDARDALVPCSPGGVSDPGCSSEFVRVVGRRLWRRDLTDEEVATTAALADHASETLGDFYDGLEYGLASLLQSPNFLYRPELGAPVADAPGPRQLDDHEIASRLSFFLWDAPPDETLLAAADAGELTDPDLLRGHAERMAADDRFRTGVRAFFADMLRFIEFGHLDAKDPTVFVHMSPDVYPAAQEETLRFLEWLVVEEDGDYREAFTSRTTFINRKLASIYGVPAPSREGFGMVTYPQGVRRAGLLGHLSFLALNAGPARSSPTLRGKFVRQTFLCGSIPPPPPAVNAGLPEPSGTTLTLRERVAEHLQDPSCAGCHSLMDPIGLGLEHFDALGRYRTIDGVEVDGVGAPIDASGDMNGVPYADHIELGQVVAEHPDLPRCIARTVYRYATGHRERLGETESLRNLTEGFVANGYRVKDLMVEVVMDPGFRFANDPDETTEGE